MVTWIGQRKREAEAGLRLRHEADPPVEPLEEPPYYICACMRCAILFLRLLLYQHGLGFTLSYSSRTIWDRRIALHCMGSEFLVVATSLINNEADIYFLCIKLYAYA